MTAHGRPARRTVAVVGAGWAGLSAAVQAVSAGHQVSLFDMAHQAGGRARTQPGTGLDNGQHILIGAYRETLALMRTVGADPDAVLQRRPLLLQRADGRALALRAGAAIPAFVAAVWRCPAWTWRDKLALLRTCGRWAAGGFRCQPDRSVAALCGTLPPAVRDLLIDPLCVAALNTPAPEASAQVFLRVLQDGLFGGRGACDLLLPRRPLHDLLPGPALHWLRQQGAHLRLGQRVMQLTAADTAHGPGGWQVDGQRFDAVLLATPATEAARLCQAVAPAWATQAAALRFEPIITVYTRLAGARLPAPMLALAETAEAPAQFVFDHGQLGGPAGQMAFVISGAAPWVQRGLEATAQAVLAQARRELPASAWPAGVPQVLATVAEKRATFRCTPALLRPPARVAPGLLACGDYVAGPYPATLEGAVRAGRAVAEQVGEASAATPVMATEERV